MPDQDRGKADKHDSLFVTYTIILCPQKVTGPSYNKHCTTHIFPYRLSASIYTRQILFTVYAWSGLWNGMITGI